MNRPPDEADQPGSGGTGARGTGTGQETVPCSTVPLTWLYVPGDRPEVVTKALRSGADIVLVDLEDAVPPERKTYAREATAELLSEAEPGPVPVHVRINALDGPLAAADTAALAGLPGLGGLRLPKVEGPAALSRVVRWTGDSGVPPLYALLESALGIENAFTIATAHPAVHGLALGEADLRAALGVTDDTGLGWARGRLVVAARAAGLAPPAQSVYTDVRDIDGLARSCAEGRALGFVGRCAIHPRQLPVIERAYLPTEREVQNAEAILRAGTDSTGAAALPDGTFVDAAVVAGARRTLALARRR